LQRRRFDGALQRLTLSPVAPVGPTRGQQNDDRARNRSTAQYDRQRLFLDMTQPSEFARLNAYSPRLPPNRNGRMLMSD